MTLLPSPSLQQNHKKGGGRHFLTTKPSKKVAAVVVFFFNTNLLPSPSALQAFYATMNKKEGVAIVTFFSLLQKRKERRGR
jgi:hypothetical protein